MVESQSDFVRGRLAFAAECIELAKKEKPVVEDAALSRTAFIFRKGDDPVMVHHCTVADVTPEDFKKYTRNYRAATLDFFKADGGSAKVSLEVVKEVNGSEVIHQRMDPGVFMVSARSTLVQLYHIDEGNGSHIFFASSKDSANFEKEFAGKIGKDVIGTLQVNYWHFRPTADGNGSVVTHVNCSNPNGSIPNAIVDKMTKKQSEAILNVAKWVRENK